jgi:hypothetical protein
LLGPPAGAHTTAVDGRKLPPVRRGSAGAEHPEGGLLDGFCLNKQAPRSKKNATDLPTCLYLLFWDFLEIFVFWLLCGKVVVAFLNPSCRETAENTKTLDCFLTDCGVFDLSFLRGAQTNGFVKRNKKQKTQKHGNQKR